MGVLRAAGLVLTFLILGGCPPTAEPGEPIGIFSVEGRLQENACGSSALPAQDPLRFQAELRATDRIAYWKMGRQYIAGSREGRSFALMTSRSVTLIPPDRAQAITGCAVRQDETIRAELRDALGDGGVATGPDAGDADFSYGSFGGTNTIEFVPVPGSDCRAALSANGGPWLALPCRVRYDLVGARD